MLGYYVLHGMLHLAGYDHERGGAAAAAAMAAKEESLQELLRPLASGEGDE
jgi:ssRNA-specific RNase YbeY (16S rRNA maturation enzyme)